MLNTTNLQGETVTVSDSVFEMMELFTPAIKTLPFDEAMKLYEKEYTRVYRAGLNVDDDTDFAFILNVFGRMIANSVLKRLVNVSYNPLLVELKDSLFYDVNNLNATIRHSNNEYSYTYNDKGEREKTLDKETASKYNECFNPLSDAYDLVHEAIASLIRYSYIAMKKQDKHYEVYKSLNMIDDMKRAKTLSLQGWDTVKMLTKKTFVDKVEARTYYDNTKLYIQRVFKNVRDYVDSNKGIGSFKYLYMDDIDPNTGETYYQRYERISAITSRSVVGYTVRQYNASLYDGLMERVQNGDFTHRQLEIIQLKLQGYSHQAICDKLKLKAKSGITKHLQAIALKLLDMGYFPKYTNDFLLCNTEALKKYTQQLIKHYQTMYIVEEASILNNLDNPIFSDPKDPYQAYIKDIVYKTIEEHYTDSTGKSAQEYLKQVQFFIG